MTYKDSSGLIYIYQNTTENKEYLEATTYKELEGYSLEGYEGVKVQITCMPGETKWLRCIKQQFTDLKMSSSSSYKITQHKD